MDWQQARDLLRVGGRRSTGRDGSRPKQHTTRRDIDATRAGSICVASGKGGTGKSIVTASLARLLARRGKTLIVDADMGVGNAHIMQNVAPRHSFVDVVEGGRAVSDIVQPVQRDLDLLAAGSGVSHMAGLSSYEMHLVGVGLELIETEYQSLIVDSAAGISRQTVGFAAASDVVLLVTTPDVTALTDAYAFLKVFLRRKPDMTPLLIVNRASNQQDADRVARRMCNVSRRFLGRAPRYIGSLPGDDAAIDSVNARVPVVDQAPNSRLAVALRALSVNVIEELSRHPHRGLGRSLLRSVGYTPGRP